MRNSRDTFLHFLSDNLTGLTIHPIRKDPDNPSLSTMQMGAVNVGFGSVDPGILLSTVFVKIDILAETELDAVDSMQQVWALLSSAFYTPLLDYTDPSNPVVTGTMLMWKQVRFVPVPTDAYFQFSCTLSVRFHNS
jgi:hypothetical protein